MGWYPDPTNPAQERYWEGTRWTHNVKDPQPDSQWSSGLGAPHPAADHHQAAVGQSVQPQGYPGQTPVGQSHPHQGQVHHTAAAALLRPVTEDGVPLASFGQRLLARLLDNVAVSAVAIPLAWPSVRRYFAIVAEVAEAGGMSDQLAVAEKVQGPAFAIALIWVAVTFAYQLLMVGLTSRTLGKMALGLRVVPVGRGRERAGWGAALIRAVGIGGAALVDISIGIVTVVACLLALQKPRQQALHDRFARTQVTSSS